MIYFFYNTPKEKVHTLVQGLLKRKPDAMYFRFDEDTFDGEFLKGLFESQGLFEAHHIVYLDELYTTGTFSMFLKEMQKSENIFVVYERDLLAKDLKQIEGCSEKVVKEEKVKKKSLGVKENPFALTEALGKRDKKKAWILYQDALISGKAPEEIQGLLFWQVKSMVLASRAKNATDTGLKPFVYTKAKGFAKNYTQDELIKMSAELVHISDQGRKGGDVGVLLEKFLLTL